MARGFKLMKRIRKTWSRLFHRKPKIYEFEGFDEDNQMSEDDLEELVSGVTRYVEKMRAEHMRSIDLIRRGHDSTDDMDSNQNYYLGVFPELRDTVDNTGVEYEAGMEGESQPETVMNEENEITCIRCEKYGCEVVVKIRPVGQ